MNKYLFKMKITLLIGLFVMGGMSAFGQQRVLPEITPSGSITLQGDALHEHGANSSYTGTDPVLNPDPDEVRDIVMVGSTMPYFIMPDENYNAAYYAQNNWELTNLTTSRFVWSVEGLSTIVPAPVNQNTVTYPEVGVTNTSPWVTINWLTAALGDQTIKVMEMPPSLAGLTCQGVEVEIPVTVIAEPTLVFNGLVGSECKPIVDGTNKYTIKFPFTAITESPLTIGGVATTINITYTLIGKGMDDEEILRLEDQEGVITRGVTTPGAAINGRIPVTIVGSFDFDVEKHGHYELEIISFSDHIARKCLDDEILFAADTKFTFSVLPAPQRGRIFHVPNRF